MEFRPRTAHFFTLAGTAVLIALAAPGTSFGQPANHDYYFDRSNTSLLQVLGNVESHHLPQGAQKARERRYEAALADYEFILRYFPNHPKALLALGELCTAWRSPKCNAEEWFARGIAINPQVAGTYTVHGIYLLRQRRANEAIENLKQAVALDTSSLNAHYNLGLAYLELKQHELANEHGQKAYALGAPVPGLRDKLKRAGHWKPIETPSAQAPQTPPDDVAAEKNPQ